MNDLRINTPDEDVVEFFVGETLVGAATYDEHGSSGMRLATTMFTNFATLMGIVVQRTHVPDDHTKWR